ncbi:MAG: hypothetical protein FWF18_01225 [Dehalococcoidia bacterium]|nr:hypothetical protein [Dehalococcoidia bacterium]
MKKRIITFISNWLGVFIAIIIMLVSGVFGWLYLDARSRLESTLNTITQIVILPYNEGFVQSGTINDPPANIFHITIQVYNIYPETVGVTVSDISIDIDGYSFNMSQDGQWSKDVPIGYAIFEGNITIGWDIMNDLIDQSPVEIIIRGNISASGKYRWVQRHIDREFRININDATFSTISRDTPE